MLKPMMMSPALGMMLIGCAVTGCGNKGELFLDTDVQLARELENVSNRIGDDMPSTDGTEQPTADDIDKTKTLKKSQQ